MCYCTDNRFQWCYNEPTYLSPADYESQLADIQAEYEELWAAANAAA